MIEFKTGSISKKEKKIIEGIISECPDVFGDFYITKNNLRLYIKENLHVLYDCLKKGDKLVYDENNLCLIVGYSDNANRKYLKVLAKEPEKVIDLLKVADWNVDCDLFIKVKKNNPLRKIIEKNYFKFMGSRGTEILFVKKKRKK